VNIYLVVNPDNSFGGITTPNGPALLYATNETELTNLTNACRKAHLNTGRSMAISRFEIANTILTIGDMPLPLAEPPLEEPLAPVIQEEIIPYKEPPVFVTWRMKLRMIIKLLMAKTSEDLT